jgi:hypothetical protein
MLPTALPATLRKIEDFFKAIPDSGKLLIEAKQMLRKSENTQLGGYIPWKVR